mgnify:CR=1 FL=1
MAVVGEVGGELALRPAQARGEVAAVLAEAALELLAGRGQLARHLSPLRRVSTCRDHSETAQVRLLANVYHHQLLARLRFGQPGAASRGAEADLLCSVTSGETAAEVALLQHSPLAAAVRPSVPALEEELA